MRLSPPIPFLKRRARTLSRAEAIPLHEALDRVARLEGFASWSLLSQRAGLTSQLEDGDMLLLAARPRQGKTMLGLRLLADAARMDRRAVLFTLEYSEDEARRHMRSVDDGAFRDRVEIVASDAISADFIIRHLAGAPSGTVAVIDYLQILDQKRSTPALGEQLATLQRFCGSSGIILAFISQIDRRFDSQGFPGLGDVRLPNPIDLKMFSKACFVHAGKARLEAVA